MNEKKSKVEEIDKVVDITVLKGLLKVVMMSKKMKDKLLIFKLGDASFGYIPGEDEVAELSKTIASIISEDPLKFSSTTAIVTHPFFNVKSYSLKKLKSKFTMFCVGDHQHRPKDEEIKAIEESIGKMYDAAKISRNKFKVIPFPLKVAYQEKVDEQI